MKAVNRYRLSVKWKEVGAALILLTLNLSLLTRPAPAQFAQFVPTKTSELTNDAGFITSAGVPTVLSAFTNDAGFITSAGAPVQSVAGLTGAISASGLKTALAIAQSDVAGLTSALAAKYDASNPSGYITSAGAPVQSVNGATGAVTLTLAANTTATASNFFTAYNSSTGAFTKAQPAFSDLSGSAAIGQIPTGTSGTTVALGNHTHTFASLTSPPTNLLGYGITDATNKLVPTAVKTSAYTAAVNDFVPVDASGGSVTITLPNAPADGARVGIKLIAVSGANTCTIALQGSDVLNKTGGNTSGTLKLLNHGAILQYKASGAIWYVTGEDLPLSQADLRYAQLANNGSDFVPATFRTNLGATTVGANLFTLANPSAISFAKINADNSVTAESPSAHRTSIGLAIGTNVEAWDTDLDSWAAITRASGFDTFAATPSSANFASLLTDEISAGTSPKVIFGDQAVATTSSPSFTGLTVSGGTITGGSSGMTLAAGGSNQSITLTPSGSGKVAFSSLAAIDSSSGSGFAIKTAAGGSTTALAFRFRSENGKWQIADDDNDALKLGSVRLVAWGTTDAYNATLDSGLGRNAQGTTESNSGTLGQLGRHKAGSVELQNIPTPAASPSAAVAGTAGTTTISYSYTDCQADVSCTAASPIVTVTTANATLSAGNKVTLTFPALGANTTYRNVYRTATNGTSPTTTGKINASNVTTTTFDDTGLAASGSAPTKNLTASVVGPASGNLNFLTGVGGVAGLFNFADTAGVVRSQLDVVGSAWAVQSEYQVGAATVGSTSRRFYSGGLDLIAGDVVVWRASNFGTQDAGLARNAAGITESNSGTVGKFGQLQAGTIAPQTLATPGDATASIQGAAGTTTITYKIAAEQADGSTTVVSAGVTPTTANATLTGTNFVRLTLPALPSGATRLAIYRTATNGTAPTTTGKIGTSTTGGSTFDDTGLAASGSAPTINTTGAINTTKALGTTTNDSAQTGYAGEYVSSTVATGSSVSLTTNTAANVTSVSLTAGDWDVDGNVDYTFAATTSYTILQQGISTTSATTGAQDQFTQHVTPAQVPTASADPAWSTPTVRISISGTTTVYLVAKATFTVSTLKAYGTLRARRVR